MTPRALQLPALLPFLYAVALGCQAVRHEGQDWPPPRPAAEATPGSNAPVAPPPETRLEQGTGARSPAGVGEAVVSGVGPALKGRLSDAEKQSVLEKSLISLLRVILSSEEKLQLSAGPEASTTARGALTTKLAELQFKVIESDARLGFSPSEEDQDRYRLRNDCNLVFLVEGGAKQADKFGEFFSFESQLKGKVLNLTAHQVIAEKTFLKRGKRATDERQAAESAQEAAAADLVAYLSDEVARKWEVTSLVKVDLEVSGLGQFAQADDLRVGLQRRPGVFYVSLESWDRGSERAKYEVLCRFDVERFIGAYVDELRLGNVVVKSVKRKGEEIRARKGLLDLR
ncbi:MAG: hypothetical protein HY721_22290 [Planctomycetes bacterium]|nr:hypothetical protein [Planctomycetota bacterium]